MENIEFHQSNIRIKSQPFSEDTFGLILSEVISGCVRNPKKYIKLLHENFKHVEFSDNIKMMQRSSGGIDYLVDIGFACHVLYGLLPESDSRQEDNIFKKLQNINNAIAPRPGEVVKRPVWKK